MKLQPMLPTPAEQRWLWTVRWQATEREADDDELFEQLGHSREE